MQQRKANPEGSTTTIDGKHIQLTVEKIDDTALEIAIINLDFSEDHRMAMKYLVVSLATCTILFLLLAVREIGIYSCAVGIIGFQVYRMLNLVKFGNLCMALVNDDILIINFAEKIVVVQNTALQVTTEYTLGRRKCLFISRIHIHDVVITETILNVCTAERRDYANKLIKYLFRFS